MFRDLFLINALRERPVDAEIPASFKRPARLLGEGLAHTEQTSAVQNEGKMCVFSMVFSPNAKKYPIVTTDEFAQQIDAAMDLLFYSDEAANRETVDLIWINPPGKRGYDSDGVKF